MEDIRLGMNIQPSNDKNDKNNKNVIPTIIFIVPYRDRKYHMNIFNVMMKHILEDYDEKYYEICFAHQMDARPFNRGAMKNLGFYAMKQKYPENYKDITFVFNDIDTVPSMKGLINYETESGIIKHFYGFPYALGGIFSITGSDFEKINGFPCYWSWGYEDNVINTRATKMGLTIDRSVFYKVGNQAILQTVDSFVKNVNKKHKDVIRNDRFIDGINTIENITYTVDGNFINFKSFEPLNTLENEDLSPYNMLENKYLNNSNNTMADNIRKISKPYLPFTHSNTHIKTETVKKDNHVNVIQKKSMNISMNMSRNMNYTNINNPINNMSNISNISRENIRRGGLSFIKS